ncbi:MAG: SGNH/GDSL hydrolase family protein [Planctomycetota bacterium]
MVRIVLGMMYCLIVCELFLRLFSPVPLLPHGFRVTTYGLRGNEINRNYRHTTPEYCINIRTNSKGIRADREIPYKRTDGVKRIVLLGDSFGMGYGVNLEDTFSSQMKKFLQGSEVNSEIVNLGVPAYGNTEELVVLKEEGLKYQPDLVLLAWHPSDYSENVQSNLFGLENGRLIRRNKTYLPKARIREFLFQFGAYRWIAGNVQFYKFIRNVVYLHIRKPIAAAKTKLSAIVSSRPGKGDMKTEIQTDRNKPDGAYRRKLTIELLKEMKRECISNGANFLIFDIPIRISRTEFESRFLGSEDDTIKYFDVFNPIELFKRQNGKKIYWEKSEGHFTPLGCRIVGKGLAEFALSKNLVNGELAKFDKGIVQ